MNDILKLNFSLNIQYESYFFDSKIEINSVNFLDTESF